VVMVVQAPDLGMARMVRSVPLHHCDLAMTSCGAPGLACITRRLRFGPGQGGGGFSCTGVVDRLGVADLLILLGIEAKKIAT
jgi:hypothetical protein